MARGSFTVTRLANEAGIDVDEALIVLWDAGLEYIVGPASTVRRRDTNRARRLVGLATRRELASRASWQQLFKLEDNDFSALLESLSISTSTFRKLSKKAVNKLRAEARARGLSWISVAHYEDERPSNGAAGKSPDGGSPSRPFVLRTIGKEREIKYLTGDDVRAIHEQLVSYFADHSDPIEPPGVRNDNLLESAIERPKTALGDVRKYPTVEMAGAALLHSLVHNHPFHNGNKRTGLVSMLAFLDLNRLLITCDEDELFKTVLRIAQHAIATGAQLPDREVAYISEWISTNSRSIELGDRPIPFRRLRKLLTRHECICDPPKGNHVTVTRSSERKRRLRKSQEVILSAQVPYRDVGREIPKSTIARLRKELELDEPHGIDSASFYDNAPAAAGEFVLQFRKTLRRLASL